MMIQKFHRLIASKVVWIGFCVLIAIAFVGLYMPGASQNRQNAEAAAAGELNGKSISQDEFRHHYVNIFVRFTMQDLEPPKITDEVDAIFRQMAWRRLATLQEAEKMGIRSSNQEVIDRIKADPTFQVEGAYSAGRYQAFVQQFLPRIGITETQFEQHIREETAINKMRFIVAQSALIPPHELKRRYNTFKDKFVVEHALVTRDLVEDDVTLSDEETKAFFEKNIEDFRVPVQVGVSLVQFRIADFFDKIEEPVTVADARTFYDENAQLFTFLPAEEEADDAETVTDEEPEPTEPAELPAEDAVADADDGDIDEDLATDVEEDEEIADLDIPALAPITQPFEEVKEELILSLSRRDALSLAAERATDLAVEATPLGNATAPSFEEVAKEFGCTITTLEPFGETEELVGLGVGGTFNNAAFSLEDSPDMQVSDPVLGEDVVYVLKLDKRIESRLPELEEVTEAARAAALEDAIESALAAKANEIQEAGQANLLQDKEFKSALKAFNVEVKKTQEFTAATGSLELDSAEVVLPEIVSLNVGEVTPPLRTEDGYVIAHVVSRKDADPSDFATVRDQIQTSLRRRQATTLFEEWQKQLLVNGNFVDRRDVEAPAEEDVEEELDDA